MFTASRDNFCKQVVKTKAHTDILNGIYGKLTNGTMFIVYDRLSC